MQQWLPGFAEVESPISVPCHIPSEYKYTDTSQPELFFLHLPMKMEPIEGSETSAFKHQTPGKYPKENILHKEHGESLKYLQYLVCFNWVCY
jgi:hypothetical protein